MSSIEYIARTHYCSHAQYIGAGRKALLIIEIRLNELLAQLRRSHYWLAKETGISHSTLWRLKKGEPFGIKLETLEKMCLALGCEPGDILTLNGKKRSQKQKNHSAKTKR